MRLVSALSLVLSIATHCTYVLGEELTGSDDFVGFGGQGLFDNTFDLSSSDVPTFEDPTLGSLQAIDGYTSENALFSPPPPDLLSADQASACLTGDSSNLFGRSDGLDMENFVAQSDFCFQEPDKPSTELPPLTLPNLFDLLQPDPEKLFPSDTFPKRPVCSRDYPYRLCCEGAREDGMVWDCIECE